MIIVILYFRLVLKSIQKNQKIIPRVYFIRSGNPFYAYCTVMTYFSKSTCSLAIVSPLRVST